MKMNMLPLLLILLAGCAPGPAPAAGGELQGERPRVPVDLEPLSLKASLTASSTTQGVLAFSAAASPPSDDLTVWRWVVSTQFGGSAQFTESRTAPALTLRATSTGCYTVRAEVTRYGSSPVTATTSDYAFCLTVPQ
jgi:hypothetical protein